MHPVDYARPPDLQAAIAAVAADPAASFVAGGTELVNWMKDGIRRPSLLVDLGDLPLREIEAGPDGLRLGALARMADVAAHPAVRAGWPVLSQALEAGASPQVRNAATLGGNLLQRTRCPYFRETTFPCNKRTSGSGCAARTGPHHGHAILGYSDACIAVHPSDLAVALLALDAGLRLRGPAGERRLPLGEFYLLPGETPERETVLGHGEAIVAVELPAAGFAARSRYVKVRERASFAFALVSVAAAVELGADRRVTSARIVLGSVAPVPWRARAAEDALVGRPLDADAIAAAGRAAVVDAAPLPDTGYKVTLAGRAVVRALSEIATGEGGAA
jgi:xanthine dehydrogenase YagS FAD-binding subunit